MSADIELLELAAKAHGNIGILPGGLMFCNKDGEQGSSLWWNPLEDDADALRLATIKCMTINTGPCVCSVTSPALSLMKIFIKEETINQRQIVAVRRAIVRAAAEIGRAMP